MGQTTLCLPQLGPYAARDAINLPPDNEYSPFTSSTPTDNSVQSKSEEQPVKGQLKIAVIKFRKLEEKGHFPNMPFSSTSSNEIIIKFIMPKEKIKVCRDFKSDKRIRDKLI